MDKNANYSLQYQNQIRDLRSKILQEFDTNPELYDEVDRQKITRKGDLWITRFLDFLDQGPEKAYEHMVETFRWRKTYGINHFSPLEMPREIFAMSPVFEYYPDPEGRRMLYCRVKMHRKLPQMEDRVRKFFVHFIERMDNKANCKHGIQIVFDMTGSGYANADVDFMLFVLPTIRRYFPLAVKTIFILGLPWMLNSLARFCLSLVPNDTAKKVRFMTVAEFHTVMPIERIPDFLGGSGTRNYYRIPAAAKPALQLEQENGMSEPEIIRLMKPSLKFIEEGTSRAVTVTDYDDGLDCL